MNVIYNLSGFLILASLIAMVAGLMKPQSFSGLFKKYANRKVIALSGMVSIITFSSLLSATEPASVKQARLDKENGSKIATIQPATVAEPVKPVATVTTPKPVIEKKDIEEKQIIPFGKQQKNDANLASGKTALAQPGQNGEKTTTYEVTYTDGKETARTKKTEAMTTAVVDEITAVGTYIAPAPKPATVYVAPKTTTQAPTQTHGTTRTGATCRDGSHSNATGSGACSHHGGVATWLYN